MSGTKRVPRVLIGLILLSILLVALLISPFAAALFTASVFAGALHPLCDRLARRLGDRRWIAAALITVLVLLAVVIPIAALATVLVKETADALTFIRETLRQSGVEGLISLLPQALQSLAHRALASIGEGAQELAGVSSGKTAAAAVGGALSAVSRVAIQVVLMLVALYFLLIDGRALVVWIEQVSPLPPGLVREILADFRKVSVAVMRSSVLTAFVQAIAALVGFLIARAPHPIFFTFVTFLLAFVPAVGAASVSIALALLLFATGHPIGAVFLTVWGIVAVGLVDNIAKPLFMKDDVELHGAVVFFALLGGMAVFGAIGLLAGPLVVALFLSLVRVYRRDYVMAG